MDTHSVEANLHTDPPLAGKTSWARRRMVYTLLALAPYGNNYKVQLLLARARFTKSGAKKKLIQPFTGRFSTRNRALVYLGVEGEEQGRLVLYNLTQQQKTLLIPKDLVVVDFKAYPPDGEKFYFLPLSLAYTSTQLLPCTTLSFPYLLIDSWKKSSVSSNGFRMR